jgi:hypothetical protein
VAEEPSSEPTAENYNLRVELARYRGVLRWFCGSFEQSDTAESCGVAWRRGRDSNPRSRFACLRSVLFVRHSNPPAIPAL